MGEPTPYDPSVVVDVKEVIVGAVVSWKVRVTALSLPVFTPSVVLEFFA